MILFLISNILFTYNRAQAILCLESVLKHIQGLAADPTDIILTYINTNNVFFHQLLPLLPYEPVLYPTPKEPHGLPPVISS